MLRKLALVLLSAMLFVLGQPNFLFEDGLFFLSFIALAPVFYAVETSSLRMSFVLGFLFGLLSYAGMCFWLSRYAHGLFFIALFSYSILYGLCFLAMKLLARCYPAFSFPCMALVFCVTEYLKSLGPLGFSYGITGYSLWKFRPMLLAASVAGVWAASASCVFFSALSAQAFVLYGKEKLSKAAVPFAVLVLCASLFVLLGWQVSRPVPESRNVTVILVQNNADSRKYSENGYKQDVAALVSLSEEALSVYPEADFVVWPETAIVPPILYHYEARSDTARFNAVSSVLGLMVRNQACFIIGNQHVDGEGEDCNAALVFDRRKKKIVPPDPELYVKQHLVPFSESLPFYSCFSSLYDRTFPDRSFIWKAGDSMRVFSSRGISFSVPICFEDTFGLLCSRFVKNGAECLFNISNDSWSSSPVCQRQHLAMSVFRAAENGVPVLRSTASGVTCVIDREGRVVEELEGFSEGFLGRKVAVPVNRKLYPYTRYGDWLALAELCALLSLSLTAALKKLLKAVERRRQNKVQ